MLAKAMAEEKLKLRSSQGEIFDVEPEVWQHKLLHFKQELRTWHDGGQVATMSTLIKNMVEECCAAVGCRRVPDS